MREKILTAILSPKIDTATLTLRQLNWWLGRWGGGEVERRFDQLDLRVIKNLEILLLNAANGELHVGHGYLSDALSSYIEGDVDQARLKVQLLMIPDMINTAFDGSIKRVITLRTLTDAMKIHKGMLSEMDKLLKIYFTFPVTNATAE